MNTQHPALGEVDTKGGEFWLTNPWNFEWDDYNLSMFENNCMFLNVHGTNFLEVGYLSGADLDSDTRSVAVGDLNNDGMPDLLVRSVGGRPLAVFFNALEPKKYLKVSLRGVKSNGLGIGARLICESSGKRIYRDMFPENTLASQNPAQILFGLGDATRVESLTVAWPSGTVQKLSNIQADQHIEITEGENRIRKIGK